MCTQVSNCLTSCCSSVGAFASTAGQAIGNALSYVIAAIQKLASTIFAGVGTGFNAFTGLSMPVQAGVVVGVVAAVAAAAWACGCFGKKAEGEQKQEDVKQDVKQEDVKHEDVKEEEKVG